MSIEWTRMQDNIWSAKRGRYSAEIGWTQHIGYGWRVYRRG